MLHSVFSSKETKKKAKNDKGELENTNIFVDARTSFNQIETGIKMDVSFLAKLQGFFEEWSESLKDQEKEVSPILDSVNDENISTTTSFAIFK